VATTSVGRFPSPFEVETPPGADGWERLYPYYHLCSESRRDFEEGKFWFWDSMHNPEPIYPFDTIMIESWWVALNQYTTRVWQIPPALGIDQRIVNGYLYVSPNTITDPDVIQARVATFQRRAGHYYDNWESIYQRWIAKAEDCIERLKAIRIADLPELEDESVVFEARGLSSGFDLLASYSRLLENMHEAAYYHFEMLNLGYGAYLTFRDFCQRAFPGIADGTIARMVGGIDILFFRPDDEVRKLAALALELGIDDLVMDGGATPEETLGAIGAAPRGGEWLAAFEQAKDPWFWYSTGSGYNHQHRAWVDDLRLPFNAMRGYIEKLRGGEPIDRPLDEIIAERTRITAEYRELLGTDEDRTAFDDLVELARTVYPYVENHNFYIEHWHHSIFWNKVRELGQVFVEHGFFEDSEDVFYLHRYEIYSALYDLETGWATTTPARGPSYWPAEVAERRRIMEALRRWSPPPALGTPPEVVNEPFSIMLWGITTDAVERWLGVSEQGDSTGELHGIGASSGIVEGPARVIATVDELEEVQTGEILVCPITAPSWAPVFARIGAAVCDVGGIMAHASIVCREYGLPAVVGTGYGTKAIRTGQRLRVDGDAGTVTLID
jgi:pyruvate,water dikinase